MSDEYLNYNRIKRERIRRKEIHDRIVEMRKKLPVYNLEEIREYKMPFYDALLKNLEAKGFISSASFLQQLVEFQTKAREEAGPGSNVWMRPQLRYSNKELKYLTEELRKAEEFHFAENYAKECETFLRLGIHFAFSHSDWWWLGEQILVQSINVSGNYTSLQGTFEALSRFAYAKFLIKNLKEYENAIEQLIVARELSKGKGQNLETYFPDEQGTLYMQINFYTYKCLIIEVKNAMKSCYRTAIEIAIQAKKRAAEACYKEGETHALLMKGLCEMNIDDAKNAILSFNKALKLQEENDNKEALCQVMIQLAKAYLMDNKTGESLRILNALKNTAARYQLHYYLGEAYKNMGDYYLNNGEYALARRLLTKSLNFFEQEKNSTSDIASVQFLESIAWGLELLPKYVNLVYNSGNTAGPSGIENLNKLIDWKDSRQPFWDENLEERTSFGDILSADGQVMTHSTLIIEQYRQERKMSKEVKKQALEESKKEQTAGDLIDHITDDTAEEEDNKKPFKVIQSLSEEEMKFMKLQKNLAKILTSMQFEPRF